MRPIDADALKNMGYYLQRTYRKDASTMVYEVKQLDDVPTIEAEPVRRGRWLAIKEKAPWLVCSECGTYLYNEQKSVSKYCYNCGAKMEREED